MGGVGVHPHRYGASAAVGEKPDGGGIEEYPSLLFGGGGDGIYGGGGGRNDGPDSGDGDGPDSKHA